ncbi:hypothetical protein DSM3645_27768 [Blastopirellula marina DSM 3645]|uniref:Uncharacterized protein n=1 Tax=Blastopirellula marina DSM 3645 TaxID=314230 RepID=A3ZX71_9BACT|nr:hypothetical protein DSM3645_27768 [Blastopirellula marina DSM 3645]
MRAVFIFVQNGTLTQLILLFLRLLYHKRWAQHALSLRLRRCGTGYAFRRGLECRLSECVADSSILKIGKAYRR